MKILIVDDEIQIQNIIAEYCRRENFEFSTASDGFEALDLFSHENYDVAVLDVMIPKLNGFLLCKEIQKIKKTPVIFLSARNSEYDKLFGFEVGGEDYMEKPFSGKELMARIKILASRGSSNNAMEKELAYENILVNLTEFRVFVDDKPIEITKKEISLLVFLIKNTNIALSRETLYKNVWGTSEPDYLRVVDSYIKNLRKLLGERFKNNLKTLHGVGYRLEKQN